MKIASHTDIFITAAYLETKNVLSSPVATERMVLKFSNTIMKLMLASAGMQRDMIDLLTRLLANNLLAKRDVFLHYSPLGSYFDKLQRTRPIFAQKLFDGFIQPAAEEAHKTGQFLFSGAVEIVAISEDKKHGKSGQKFPYGKGKHETEAWFKPSSFFRDITEIRDPSS